MQKEHVIWTSKQNPLQSHFLLKFDTRIEADYICVFFIIIIDKSFVLIWCH